MQYVPNYSGATGRIGFLGPTFRHEQCIFCSRPYDDEWQYNEIDVCDMCSRGTPDYREDILEMAVKEQSECERLVAIYELLLICDFNAQDSYFPTTVEWAREHSPELLAWLQKR